MTQLSDFLSKLFLKNIFDHCSYRSRCSSFIMLLSLFRWKTIAKKGFIRKFRLIGILDTSFYLNYTSTGYSNAKANLLVTSQSPNFAINLEKYGILVEKFKVQQKTFETTQQKITLNRFIFYFT